MPTILATGGTGLSVPHTIADLLTHGYDVVSIDNIPLYRGIADGVNGLPKPPSTPSTSVPGGRVPPAPIRRDHSFRGLQVGNSRTHDNTATILNRRST